MLTYFVLTLYCLSCRPLQVVEIPDILPYGLGSTVSADLGCRQLGDILSGDWDRRNLSILKPERRVEANQELIVYTCQQQTDWF